MYYIEIVAAIIVEIIGNPGKKNSGKEFSKKVIKKKG